MSSLKSLQHPVTEHQWSEAFFWAVFHAGEPFLEWILLQLLVKTQQWDRATDKAAVYAFVCKLVFLKSKRKKLNHACHLSRYIKNNAGHCSAGMRWGGGGLGAIGNVWRRTDQSQKTAKPLFIPSPIFMSSFSSALLFRWSLMAASSDLNGTGPWRCWCHRSSLPFTGDPSGAYR